MPAACDVRETIESMIRGQRRMRGTIVSVEPGQCKIVSELGEFPFSISAVKENKRFPDRTPKAGDRCDFKLSDTNPVKATSIRVVVPKADGGLAGESLEHDGTPAAASPSSANAYGTSSPIASSHSTSAPQHPASYSRNYITQSVLSAAGEGHEGGSGIADLCTAFQRTGNVSGSLFSS